MNRLPKMIKHALREGKPIGFVIECEDESKNAKGTIFPPSKTGWSEVTLVAKRKKWEDKGHIDELFLEAESLLTEMKFKKNNNKRPFKWNDISSELDKSFNYSTFLRHSDSPGTEFAVKTKCPDCGNPSMNSEGNKFDVLTKKQRSVFRCPQCRGWKFAREHTPSDE
tara:strand:+ start:747 stop:1247 length:501 start_codon:yes stop_codon:yes gene_type:complete